MFKKIIITTLILIIFTLTTGCGFFVSKAKSDITTSIAETPSKPAETADTTEIATTATGNSKIEMYTAYLKYIKEHPFADLDFQEYEYELADLIDVTGDGVEELMLFDRDFYFMTICTYENNNIKVLAEYDNSNEGDAVFVFVENKYYIFDIWFGGGTLEFYKDINTGKVLFALEIDENNQYKVYQNINSASYDCRQKSIPVAQGRLNDGDDDYHSDSIYNYLSPELSEELKKYRSAQKYVPRDFTENVMNTLKAIGAKDVPVITEPTQSPIANNYSGTVTVKTEFGSPLNLRAEYNTNSAVLTKIPDGTTVEYFDTESVYDSVTQTYTIWYNVEHNGTHGWVSGDYVIVN
ncbi:MAG: SH3 domain-containing protein [Ruminococcus sp.]|jgi:hypothetical protein|nr:SH3 domain-containing protein [Ruminococcus sp.]